MEKNYGQFLGDVFIFFETDSNDAKKLEKLVSRGDSPVKTGIDTATGQAKVQIDPWFINRLNKCKNKEFVCSFIDCLEDAANSRLMKMTNRKTPQHP